MNICLMAYTTANPRFDTQLSLRQEQYGDERTVAKRRMHGRRPNANKRLSPGTVNRLDEIDPVMRVEVKYCAGN